MAYQTDSNEHVPANWYGATYGDNGIPGANIGDTHTCPWTGEQLKRLTKAAGTVGDELWGLEYPSSQKISADGDKFIVNNGNTNAVRVIDSDGTLIRTLPGGAAPMGYWWSNTDNDLIYFVDINTAKKIKKIVPSTGTVTTILDLTNYIPWRNRSAQGGSDLAISRVTVGESQLSYDGRYVAVVLAKPAYPDPYKCDAIVDLVDGRIVSELYRDDVSADFFDATAYGEQGELYWKVAVIPGTGPTYWEVWDANATGAGDPGIATERWTGSTLTQTTGLGTGHNSLFTGTDGNHYFVSVDNYNNAVWRYELGAANSADAAVKLWTMGWFNSPPTTSPNGIDQYFSGKSTWKDGWIYCCVWPSAWHGDPDLDWRWLMDEVFRFKWDGTPAAPQIERMFHHRNNPFVPDYALSGHKNYWANVRIDVHRGGNVLLVQSNHQRNKEVGIESINGDVYLHQVKGPPVNPWWLPVGEA